MIELLIGTGNRHKRREIEAILADMPIRLLGPDDAGPLPEVQEDRDTLEGNASKKASEIAAATGCLVVSDDSGLEVDALDGRPGVYSARYAGPECDTVANNRKLLAEMEGVPDERRAAAFRCVIAVARPDGVIFAVEGGVEGRITREMRGDRGFGYDPVFLHPPTGLTFAQMEPARKNALSHRFHALQAFREELLKRLDAGEL